MTEQNAVSTRDESVSTKQTTSSRRRENLLTPSTSSTYGSDTEKSDRRRLTLPVSPNSNYQMSPAERYIALKAQSVVSSNGRNSLSPDSPSSISGKSLISPLQYQPSHAEIMSQWYQKQISEKTKKHKNRYVYE